ncbi:flagellar assembly peptidoglycan hydrolase FlgJ [Zobellella aerophila]|uniref:Peptidoglycan hydrolase FlgJ n=1 Tax=Zobellella aerophila TaxID=870480 RepID=A0ABP6VTI6_9GAMM
MSVNNLDSQFALDMQGLQRLKQTAGRDPAEGLEQAARQFESLFVHMMLKSMRETVPDSGLTEGDQRQFYTSLLDQQLSQELSGRGIGLADQLIRQLGGRRPEASGAGTHGNDDLIAGIPRGAPRVLTGSLAAVQPGSAGERLTAYRADETSGPGPAAEVATTRGRRQQPAHVAAFLERLEEPALAASRASGVPAELILAQAALETGWGRYEIATAEGGNSHNLFGIKAGDNWRGRSTDVSTHEYVQGRRVAVTDRFRVYDSFEAAFTDYARLLGDNPRYSGVLSAPDAQQAARALQAGGYATDPGYADKLAAVMNMLGPLDEGTRLARAWPPAGEFELGSIF